MTRTLLTRALALTIAAGLAGCAATEPPRFFTLAGPAVTVPAAATLQLAVAPVTVPESLARPQLVVRRAADPQSGRIDILEQSRWASGFDEELRQAFAERLAAALGARDVSQGGELADRPLWRIAIHLRRYDAVPGDRVGLTFGWVFGRSDPPLQIACQGSRIVALTSREPDEVVRGIRAAVAGIAETIAGQLRRAAAARDGEAVRVCADPPG